MQIVINMVSDVVTQPTDAMRKAMAEAECGDDVAQADPSVNRLEAMAAERMGMEAALYAPSGTMTNLIAIMTHCPAGGEVVLEEGSHIYYYEVGGMARVARLIPRLVRGKHGIMDPRDIRSAFREYNIHYPTTRLICVENTHNRGGGTVIPLDNLREVRAIADEKKVPVHMDGARLYNAAVYLRVDPREITRHVDSVAFCLSKGLSAPVGSVLCGRKEFIAEARQIRKMLGGGMRQAGVIAAAGIVALETMVDRLQEDHDRAGKLAESIADSPGITLDLDTVQTNLVIFDVEKSGLTATAFVEKLKAEHGIAMQARPPFGIRAVTHRHIGDGDIVRAANAVREVAERG